MAKTRVPYKTTVGKRVPSVTTILGQFKDPGALMYWSWNVAYTQLQDAVHLLTEKPNPRQIKQFLSTDPLYEGNYRSVSGKAAEAGTFAHDLVEMWIHAKKGERLRLAKQTPEELAKTWKYPVEIAEKAAMSFSAFIEWSHQWKTTVVATELRLVSDEFNFGGTIDCIAKIGPPKNRQLILLDWKTSKAVYSDYLCQIAAYGILWDEHNPKETIESYHLVRFDKIDGDFHHHQWNDVTEAQQLFLKLRECYDLKKICDRRVK